MPTTRRPRRGSGRQIRARVLGALAAFLTIARTALVLLAVGAGLAFLLLSGHALALAAGLISGAVAYLLAVEALRVVRLARGERV